MVQEAEGSKLLPELCRAARGLLDWTQGELAERAGVSRSTVRELEASLHHVHRATAAQIRAALEQAGVAFVEVEGVGPGVCLGGRRA